MSIFDFSNLFDAKIYEAGLIAPLISKLAFLAKEEPDTVTVMIALLH